jgi:hypothetical protein
MRFSSALMTKAATRLARVLVRSRCSWLDESSNSRPNQTQARQTALHTILTDGDGEHKRHPGRRAPPPTTRYGGPPGSRTHRPQIARAAPRSRAIRGNRMKPWDGPSIRSPIRRLSRLLQLHEATGHLAKSAGEILAKPRSRGRSKRLWWKRWFCARQAADPSKCAMIIAIARGLKAKSGETLYMRNSAPRSPRPIGHSAIVAWKYIGMSPKRYL